jgi:hypothetical protein
VAHTVTIKLYKRANVVLPFDRLEEVSKPLPLISNKLIKAPTTVQQGSVEIEDHGVHIR